MNDEGTVADCLRAHALQRPDATFCTFLAQGGAERITFGELYRRAAAYARVYRRLGIARGDIVLVMLKHTPHLYYSFLGAILAGAIPSFMPFPTPKQRPELFWREHRALFALIEPRLIVSYDEQIAAARAELGDMTIPMLAADDALAADEETSHVEHTGGPDDVVCLQHSSGTTGLKKGVMLTNRAIVGEILAYAERLGLHERDTIASWLPLYHDMGFVACFMTSVVLGTRLIALDPFEWVMRPTMLLDAIERYGAAFAWLPNFAFSHIVNHARGDRRWDLGTLRALVNCSEPCKPRTFERFVERFAASGITAERLGVCYAMAENVFAVTQTAPGHPVRTIAAEAHAFAHGEIVDAHEGASAIALLSCGTPIAGVQVAVRDAAGEPLADRRVGDIHVSGAYRFSGYYRRPELDAERIRDGWYRTGDRGFFDRGELFVTGRTDDMLIVNGRNYYAHEIEAIVGEIPGVVPGRVVAIGIEDERADATVVVAIAECAPDADRAAVAKDVRLRVLEVLGLALHAVATIDPGRLVKTTSGKISRSKNKELYLRGSL